MRSAASGSPARGASSALWRRLDLPGHDAVRLTEPGDGSRLEGVAVFVHEGRGCCLRYSVEVDGGWRTRRARVEGWAGHEPIDLRIEASEGGQWSLDGVLQPAVSGCVDVDLAFTPATNTLPIRRLGLAAGESRQVTAAWLRFPELVLEPLEQVYTRESLDGYRYESGGGSFRAALVVAPDGLVVRYPGLWEREAL